MMQSVNDIGEAQAQLTWTNPPPLPDQILGLAYDIYAQQFIDFAPCACPFFPVLPTNAIATLPLPHSGGYHFWASNLYVDGEWLITQNPISNIIFTGTPHTPANATVQLLENTSVTYRLTWTPDLFGTWLYQIIVLDNATNQFIETNGPSGTSLWHFIDFGAAGYDPTLADFFTAHADFTLPPGDYTFYLNAKAWDAETRSDYAVATPE